MRKSSINGPFSSTPCLITAEYVCDSSVCVGVRAHRAKMEKHASNLEVAVKQSPGAEPPRALQPVGGKDIKNQGF